MNKTYNENLTLAPTNISDLLFEELFGPKWNQRVSKRNTTFKNPNVEQAMYDLDITCRHGVISVYYKEKFVFCELDDRFPSPENVAKLRLVML